MSEIYIELCPERVIGLVSMAGSNIQNTAKYPEPVAPEIMKNYTQHFIRTFTSRFYFFIK